MHNKVGYNRLGRKASHRRALIKNLVTSLFKHERIRTTKAKALEARRTAEKMITRAKVDSVHNRRIIAKVITDKGVLNKLFTEIGPSFAERKGGYTRILKLQNRLNDAAEMVLLELVKDEEVSKKKKKKASAKKKPEQPKEESKVEEVKAEEPKTEETKEEVKEEAKKEETADA